MGKHNDQREELFVEGMVAGKSAAQAYRDAGYSENGAAQGARRKLSSPHIQERIRELNAERIQADDSIANATEMKRILTRIVRGEEKETIVFGRHTEVFTLPPKNQRPHLRNRNFNLDALFHSNNGKVANSGYGERQQSVFDSKTSKSTHSKNHVT